MWVLSVFYACATSSTDTGESGEELAETPVITFVSPADGATVPVGEVNVSVAVEHFLLVDPAKHNEGEAAGYVALSVAQGDTVETEEAGTTTFTRTLELGEATLTADLHFADGDEIGESFPDFVPASITVQVE